MVIKQQYDIKYSILLPVRNCNPYVLSTIKTIIDQNYDNYELIISDNCSTDGTDKIIETYKNHCKVKILHTPELLGLPDHFDWIQKYASGEWQIYVGGDDGLQPYFFQLADKLTDIARKKKLRTITTKRAYFFWKNCAVNYNNVAVSYYAKPTVSIEDSKKEMYRCIYGKRDCGFFDLPQMYTTSLFHASLIAEARQLQSGMFLINSERGQDFQLAALAISIEDKFLQCEIPIGWVGTSSKEDPYLKRKTISSDENQNYLNKIYSFDLMLWYVLIPITAIWRPSVSNVLQSEKFLVKLFAYALFNLKNKNRLEAISILYQYISYKNINQNKVKYHVIVIQIYEFLLKYMHKIFIFPCRCIRYILKRIPVVQKYFKECSFYISWVDTPDITMEKASEMVMELISKNLNFEDLKI